MVNVKNFDAMLYREKKTKKMASRVSLVQIHSETNTAPCKLVSRLRNKLKIERGMQKWPEISLNMFVFFSSLTKNRPVFYVMSITDICRLRWYCPGFRMYV